MFDVVTVGDVMLDVRVETTALLAGGDVPGRLRISPAGTSTNAATWAASTGATARIHARVGDDLAGRLMIEALRGADVDPAVVVARGEGTGTMLIVHQAEERSMVADRGANGGFAPADLPDRIEARTVLVSGYVVCDPATTATARAAIERSGGALVAVEAASWPVVAAFGADAFFDATRGAALLLANEAEAAELAGVDAGLALEVLAERYPRVALKRGPRGASLAWDGERFDAPAPSVRAVDPTGAGDAFDGVLLAGLARGASPQEALEAACAAGARCAASSESWPTEVVA